MTSSNEKRTRKRKRFWDGAGFRNHCWECANATDWHGEIARCGQNGIIIGKYDSPNNQCSNAGGCGYYTTEVTR